MRFQAVLCLLLFAHVCSAQTTKPASKPLPYTGVSLAGGEFGNVKSGVPRVFGKDFIYPSAKEVDYFIAYGINIFRIPFRWETLQRKLGEKLDAKELSRLKAVIRMITAKRAIAILDPHNYARYYDKVIGGPEVSDANFSDFWRQLAVAFREDDLVWFGLMNEPHDLPAEQWLGSANSAIEAIRKTTAKTKSLSPGSPGAEHTVGRAAEMPSPWQK